MEADVRWCPHCKLRGETKRQRKLQINDSSAVMLCENEKCVNLGKMSPISSLILQRKSSEIPNIKRKKCVSVISSTPKMINASFHLKPTSSTPYSKEDNFQSTPDVLTRTSSSETPNTLNNESEILLRATVSLRTMPQVVLWRNKNALCWLDACMCILISCRSLRDCLVKLPESSIMRTLCLEFVGAQKRPATDNAETCQDVNARCLSKLCADGVSAQLALGQADGLFAEPCPAVHVLNTENLLDDTTLLPGTSPKDNSAIPTTDSLHEDTTVLTAKSLKENSHNQEAIGSNGCPLIAQNHKDNLLESKHCTKTCHNESSSDPLEKVRDELFKQLQPVLKCDVGQDESPVLALPILFHLDGSIEEHFMCRYRWEFYCTACGHTQVNPNKKALPTFTSVPVDFNMTDPVMLQNCPQCRSHNQRNHLVFHSLPSCVMMHFQDGLTDSDLSRHHSFIFEGDTYTLSAVVWYLHNPNHFVTVIRDQETNHWLEYDDILPSPMSWQPHPPAIPPREIHILVWECLDTPCTACELMHNDVTTIRDAPVRTTGSCIPGGNVNAVSQQTSVSLWNENVIRRKGRFPSRFASPSVFQRETEQNIVSRRNTAGHTSDTNPIDKSGRAAGATCISKPGEQRTVHDLMTDTVCGQDLVADPHTEDENELRTHSIIGLDLNSSSKGNAQDTSRLSVSGHSAQSHFRGFKQDESTEKPNYSEQNHAVMLKKIEPVQQRKKLKTRNDTTAKPMPKLQNAEPTFISKVMSRRKTKNEGQVDVTKANTSILGKIPGQLLNYSRVDNVTSCSRIGNIPSHSEGTSTNISVFSKIPKQLLSGTVNQLMPLPHSHVEPKGKVVRPILVGSSCRVPVKQVKFQPYSHSLEYEHQNTQQENKAYLPISHNALNNSTLRSWQKRVGMYSTCVTIPRKRVRRDSTDDTCSYVDLPKHAGHPCSSVSSPSACSDISSLSDNQSFPSGKDDLTSTIDELCKVLDIGSEYTPSMSSRFSSPSQDMFLSELLADETTWAGLEEKIIGTCNHSAENSSRQQSASVPCVDHIPVTMMAATSMEMPVTCSTLCTQSASLVQVVCHKNDIVPPVESFQPAATPLSTLVPNESNDFPKAPANISSCIHQLERTLSSVGQVCPALVPISCSAPSVEATQPAMIHSTMSPSCVPMLSTADHVAMQQDLTKPNQYSTTHVTPLNDNMLVANEFDSLSDCTIEGSIMSASLCTMSNEANIEAVKIMDDITDPRLFDDIPDNLDVMDNEWTEHFMELLAQ